MNCTTLSPSDTSQKCRKILSKLNESPTAAAADGINQQKLAAKKNTSPASISSESPYMIIHPTHKKKKLLFEDQYQSIADVTNKNKTKLKLTVSRKHDDNSLFTKSKNFNNDVSSIKNNKPTGGQNANNAFEEVIINHKTLNKYVVFSLNPITDQISLSYRDMLPEEIDRNTKLQGTLSMRLRENPRKKKLWSNEADELANEYKRMKRNCDRLHSKLREVRKKHQEEKNTVGELQKKLNKFKKNPTVNIDDKDFHLITAIKNEKED